ncbi:MAG: hypothetical protein K2W92_08995 [Alphaproteobacteria bacterium]|nr:hypothetical protein [Alphaproteobacteria bacterium]
MKTFPVFLLSGLLLVTSTAFLQAERITNTPQQNENITKKEKIIGEKVMEHIKSGTCGPLGSKYDPTRC